MTVKEAKKEYQWQYYEMLVREPTSPVRDILILVTPNDNSIVSAEMDILSKCGNSEISTLLKLYEDQSVLGAFNELYSAYIYNKFYTKWSRLLLTFNTDFNPLKPLNIETEEHIVDVLTTLKDKTVVKDDDSFYGFNSSQAQPTDESGSLTDREYSRENPIDRETVRTGNIGNHDNSTLMLKYLEYVKTVVYDIIIKDICGVISGGYYK